VNTKNESVTVYVRLLNEGIDVVRPTQAISFSPGTYKLLPTVNYDSENEIWEFPPGSLVEIEVQRWSSDEIPVAVSPVSGVNDLAAIHDVLLCFDRDQRSKFLLNLANELTIAARSTYSPGRDEVESPEDLRRYNETLHRVLANLRDMLYGSNEEVWTWALVVEQSRQLPALTSACHRALELTR